MLPYVLGDKLHIVHDFFNIATKVLHTQYFVLGGDAGCAVV